MPTSYDEVPYGSLPYYFTHPDRLSILARLSGLTPASPESCRVLELGCGSGGNLIPMALALPESTFLGIDLSATQIAEGVELATAVGLSNLELRHADILDVDADYGEFDAIVCHGVYSWVPEPVRDAILRICCERLAPQGVALVSYNTYPGWGMRGMIREMMRFHVGQFAEPQTQIKQARAVLDYMAQKATQDTPYGAFLEKELELVQSCTDAYLYHEHLEETNQPFYYHRFVDIARAAGLRCLGEGNTRDLTAFLFAGQRGDGSARDSAESVRLQQYGDFLANRAFRATLLCHSELELSLVPDWRSIDGLHVAASPRDADPSHTPLTTAALQVLGEVWPQALPSSDVHATACARMRVTLGEVAEGDEGPAGQQALAEDLLGLYAKMRIELRPRRLAFVTAVSAKPVACPLAREQVARGHETPTNRRHVSVPLANFQRRLLVLLDGTRSASELVEPLVSLSLTGDIEVKEGEETVEDVERLREIFAASMHTQLEAFAKGALLIA